MLKPLSISQNSIYSDTLAQSDVSVHGILVSVMPTVLRLHYFVSRKPEQLYHSVGLHWYRGADKSLARPNYSDRRF